MISTQTPRQTDDEMTMSCVRRLARAAEGTREDVMKTATNTTIYVPRQADLEVSLFPVLWKDWALYRPEAERGPELHPVRRVTWQDAVDYTIWLGDGWRLPRDEEYELFWDKVYNFGLWEWTSSKSLTTAGEIVVRGGAWGYFHGSAACAFRGGYHPQNRFSDLGFRCVRDKRG